MNGTHTHARGTFIHSSGHNDVTNESEETKKHHPPLMERTNERSMNIAYNNGHKQRRHQSKFIHHHEHTLLFIYSSTLSSTSPSLLHFPLFTSTVSIHSRTHFSPNHSSNPCILFYFPFHTEFLLLCKFVFFY